MYNSYLHLKIIEEHILPKAKHSVSDLLKQDYDSLSHEQKAVLSLDSCVIRRDNPSIIKCGEHQLVIRVGTFYHDRKPYYICVKFQDALAVIGKGVSYTSIMKDIWLLGGNIQARKGRILFDLSNLNYFMVCGISQQSQDNAVYLRSLGLTVPFTKTVPIAFSNKNLDATITEDLTEGGLYPVFDAIEYLKEEGSDNIDRILKEIRKDLKRTEVEVEIPHGITDSVNLAIERMFLVRIREGIEELIANDFDHLRLIKS